MILMTGRIKSASARARKARSVRRIRRANQQLVISSVRQHELTEAAEKLNDQLRDEIGLRQCAAETLRESEQRFRALFELGPVAVYSCDAAGVIQQFNRRAAELWGREPAPGDTDERFCGSHKLFRPDGSFMPHDLCPMAEVIAGKIPAARDAEVIIERPDGSRLTVIVNIRPLKNERGQITGAINCFYDITERTQAEQARKEISDQLAVELAGTRRLQETSARLIHGGDTHALYQQILDAAIAIMHSDMASLQRLDEKKNALSLLAWHGFHKQSAAFWGWVRLDSGSSCAVALRQAQRIVVPDIETFEPMQGTPDLGEYRRSEIRAVQSTPLMSRSGRLLGMISTHWRKPHQPGERELRLMDVLARQAADLIERSQTEEIRAKLAAIVQSSDDAIISKDLNGIITSWNHGAERLFGYTAEEAIGRPVTTLMPPDRVDEEPGILERIRRGESVEHYETVRQRKNGVRIDVSITVSPITDDDGKVIGASKIARDITERKRTDEALRQSQVLLADRAHQLEVAVNERTSQLTATNSQLEAFVYSVAHDLRAPLRAMQGFSSILVQEAGEALSETGQDYARRISKSAHFMDAMLIDMLAFSRISQQRLELLPVSLETVIKSVLSRLEPDTQEMHAGVDAPGPWPIVLGHKGVLEQILFNLVSNALKFVYPGTPPQIRLWAEITQTPQSTTAGSEGTRRPDPSGNSQLVRVWVEDNGIGIALAHQPKIFRLFNRLHGDKYEGTGIGLAIVQKGAERMGGKVGVQSTPGHGSRFWLDLRLPTEPQ